MKDNKYTQEDISQLFKANNPSVIQRTKVKVMNEAFDEIPNDVVDKFGEDDNPSLEFGDNVDDAMDLFSKLNDYCFDIKNLLETQSTAVINTLRDEAQEQVDDMDRDEYYSEVDPLEIMLKILERF